ncbi:glycosyltransferase family 2 protein [Paenibacillus luteus]|uniref:glycosyltransferase family 2 protein n=1 Tax=Paenibacillus luteus TaxID=2545753 RepID=UPI001142962F|nr:glycosyltransferase family 2 protein [Paenibacillus luteus]
MGHSKPRLTLSMIVRNESGRYLKQALKQHRPFIDNAVIIDDGSTDDTIDICLEALKDLPVQLVRNTTSKFNNEISLRKQQWEETLLTKPEWILNLDADELFEAQFMDEVGSLIEQEEVDLYSFRLYDFWSSTSYREDHYWQAHHYYRPFLLRYKPDFEYKWLETAQHCGRYPDNIYSLPNQISALRLKHMGWANPKDRLEKYNRYIRLDPEGKFGWLEQYKSILDEHPTLVDWVE